VLDVLKQRADLAIKRVGLPTTAFRVACSPVSQEPSQLLQSVRERLQFIIDAAMARRLVAAAGGFLRRALAAHQLFETLPKVANVSRRSIMGGSCWRIFVPVRHRSTLGVIWNAAVPLLSQKRDERAI
jgi:hypothetical protein